MSKEKKLNDLAIIISIFALAVSLIAVVSLPEEGESFVFSGVRVGLSSNQAVPHAVYTKINVDTEVYDINDEFSESKFTAKTSGYYLCIGSVQLVMGLPNKVLYAGIGINGSVVVTSMDHGAFDYHVRSIVTTVEQLNISDYIELFAYHTNGMTKDIRGLTHVTYLIVYKLSDL